MRVRMQMVGTTVIRSKSVISTGLLRKLVRRTPVRRAAALVVISIASTIASSGNPALAIDPSEWCFGLVSESPDEDAGQLRIARVVGDASVEMSPVLPAACARKSADCWDGGRRSAQPGDLVVVTREAWGFICSHRFPGGAPK